MLTFKKLRYANFLAAGNAPIEVTLDENKTTLIVGVNGTGKSTLSEAICFALFGRPLRNVNKPKLVNSINGRDCLVELTFVTNGHTYLIKRGIKPTVFEVYEDNTLIPSPASVADYQTLLEDHIIKLNFKAFQQVVILGNASYVPFMRLSTGSRRELVESLLDIEVFGAMNALTKEELTELRVELDKLTQAKDLVSEQVRMAQSFTEHIEDQRQQQLVAIDAALVSVETTIVKLEQDKGELTEDLAPYGAVQASYDIAVTKQQEYEKLFASITSRDKKVKKERLFYDENDTCPTCEQDISQDFKQGRYEALTKTETDAAKAIAQCQALITKYRTTTETLDSELDKAAVLRKSIDAITAKIPVHQARVRELQADRKRTESSVTAPVQTVDAEALQKQLTDLQTRHEELSRKRVIIDAANMLLRDNGIKAKVIRHYIPIINRSINHYLTAMDFPILFTLDEEFAESIKSRYRDDFSYDSFSEGEKKRIDLALLLTWRAVARLKNSASTNLLILDEVFDSSLDANGTEEFLKIIAALEADTNIFVISHKTDQLVDKFAHTLVFEKVRGFSQLKP